MCDLCDWPGALKRAGDVLDLLTDLAMEHPIEGAISDIAAQVNEVRIAVSQRHHVSREQLDTLILARENAEAIRDNRKPRDLDTIMRAGAPAKRRRAKVETTHEAVQVITEQDVTRDKIRQRAHGLVDHLAEKALASVLATGQEARFSIAVNLEPQEDGKIGLTLQGKMTVTTPKEIDLLDPTGQVTIGLES